MVIYDQSRLLRRSSSLQRKVQRSFKENTALRVLLMDLFRGSFDLVDLGNKARAINEIVAFQLALKAASPTVSTSSSSRTSGEMWREIAKPSRTFMPFE